MDQKRKRQQNFWFAFKNPPKLFSTYLSLPRFWLGAASVFHPGSSNPIGSSTNITRSWIISLIVKVQCLGYHHLVNICGHKPTRTCIDFNLTAERIIMHIRLLFLNMVKISPNKIIASIPYFSYVDLPLVRLQWWQAKQYELNKLWSWTMYDTSIFIKERVGPSEHP